MNRAYRNDHESIDQMLTRYRLWADEYEACVARADEWYKSKDRVNYTVVQQSLIVGLVIDGYQVAEAKRML